MAMGMPVSKVAVMELAEAHMLQQPPDVVHCHANGDGDKPLEVSMLLTPWLASALCQQLCLQAQLPDADADRGAGAARITIVVSGSVHLPWGGTVPAEAGPLPPAHKTTEVAPLRLPSDCLAYTIRGTTLKAFVTRHLLPLSADYGNIEFVLAFAVAAGRGKPYAVASTTPFRVVRLAPGAPAPRVRPPQAKKVGRPKKVLTPMQQVLELKTQMETLRALRMIQAAAIPRQLALSGVPSKAGRAAAVAIATFTHFEVCLQAALEKAQEALVREASAVVTAARAVAAAAAGAPAEDTSGGGSGRKRAREPTPSSRWTSVQELPTSPQAAVAAQPPRPKPQPSDSVVVRKPVPLHPPQPQPRPQELPKPPPQVVQAVPQPPTKPLEPLAVLPRQAVPPQQGVARPAQVDVDTMSRDLRAATEVLRAAATEVLRAAAAGTGVLPYGYETSMDALTSGRPLPALLPLPGTLPLPLPSGSACMYDYDGNDNDADCSADAWSTDDGMAATIRGGGSVDYHSEEEEEPWLRHVRRRDEDAAALLPPPLAPLAPLASASSSSTTTTMQARKASLDMPWLAVSQDGFCV